jgi:hypothetical protein
LKGSGLPIPFWRSVASFVIAFIRLVGFTTRSLHRGLARSYIIIRSVQSASHAEADRCQVFRRPGERDM